MNRTNTPTNDPMNDPLIDAYRQANAHVGARPSDSVRAAALAHAKTVLEASSGSERSNARISQDMRNTGAANDRSWMMRIAAGIALGMVGVWLYQLMQAVPATDTSVAVFSAPTPAPAPLATEKQSAADAPASAAGSASAAQPAQPATAMAKRAEVAAPSAARTMPPASVVAAPPVMSATATAAATAVAGVSSAEAIVAAAAPAAPRADATSARLARESHPGPTVVTLPEPEVAIAALELRKRGAQDRALPTAVPPLPAIPATTSAPASAAAKAFPESAAASATGIAVVTAEAQMFAALRSGDAVSLYNAIARGANVNAQDERGRAALQIARQDNMSELIRILLAAGAKD